jgi:hypothetical protein
MVRHFDFYDTHRDSCARLGLFALLPRSFGVRIGQAAAHTGQTRLSGRHINLAFRSAWDLYMLCYVC